MNVVVGHPLGQSVQEDIPFALLFIIVILCPTLIVSSLSYFMARWLNRFLSFDLFFFFPSPSLFFYHPSSIVSTVSY